MTFAVNIAAQGGFSNVVALLESGLSAYPAAALYCGRGGAATLSLAVGKANLSTWFDLASLTKALCTSVLCMRLCDAGKLTLDAEVLPQVPLYALLSHQSGLPAWRPLFAEAVLGRDLTESPSAATRQAVVAAAAATPRAPLLAQALYSDLGFILIGNFLEERLGVRLDVEYARLAAALQADVSFRALDTPAQVVPIERCAPTRREDAQRALLQGVVHDDNARAMLGVAGHAGLFGTVSGVARIAEALLDAYDDAKTPAQQVLGISAATVRRFWAWPSAPAGASFGLGWDHPSPPDAGLSSAGHSWPRAGVGHLGFTGCSLWLDPETRTIVVFLTNRVCAQTSAAAARAQADIKALRPTLHDAILQAYK